MSIPLKVACCAATVTITLTSGVSWAGEPADHGDSKRGPWPWRQSIHHENHAAQQYQDYQDRLKYWMSHGWRDRPSKPYRPYRSDASAPINRQSKSAQRAQRLAELQRKVRKRRAAMEARWQRKARTAVRFARSQRGKPYVWGGTGRGGYDCSGLVQRSWRRAGVSIPRVAATQYRRIRTKVSRSKLRPGDLVFFNNLGHVGMYVGKGRFIHSPRPGRHVTVERLSGYYKRRYVGARRPAWKPLPAIPTRLP